MKKEVAPIQTMAYLLAIAHTLTCLAYAWRLNHFSSRTFSYLWSDNGFSETVAANVEKGLIAMLLIGALSIWIPKIRYLTLIGILPMFCEMGSETFMTSAKYPLIYWAEWALRYGTPVSALLLFKNLERRILSSVGILRYATAFVFAAHGIKALMADPQFLDFILVFSRRIGMENFSEITATTFVHIIGTIDMVLAAHLIFFRPQRNRMVLIWMALWGLITAFSRITYGGWGNWHEVLIRTTHFVSPAVLWLMIRKNFSNKEQET